MIARLRVPAAACICYTTIPSIRETFVLKKAEIGARTFPPRPRR